MAAIIVACNFEQRDDLGYHVFTGLFAVQHRGEKNCSITTIKRDEKIATKRRDGLIADVFGQTNWTHYDGCVVLGRIGCNYPETVISPIINLNVNGAIVYEGQLSASPKRILHDPTNATAATANYIRSSPGAYGLAIGLPDQLIVCRDPRGIRHLSIGRNENGSWFVATESASIEKVGATLHGSLEPGQLIAITKKGLEVTPAVDYLRRRQCVAELTSRMMFNSLWRASSVASWRQKLAYRAAERFSYAVDGVIPIPRASLIGARAFAEAKGLPCREVFFHNRYVPSDQISCADEIALKFGLIEGELDGLGSVALVDDMARSGKTMAGLAKRLRQEGVRLVHGILLNPLLEHPCEYGIANWPAGGVISNGNLTELMQLLNLDSLTIVTLEDLNQVFGSGMCSYCFGGEKPLSFAAHVYRPPTGGV